MGALFSILIRHWGAVERDLLTNGFRMADVETDRLTFTEFKSFVLYSPPGTAVFHQLHKGWTIGDYLAAQQVDALNLLWWAKTEKGQHNINRPEPIERPTAVQVTEADEQTAMTVEQYLQYVAEAREQEEED